MTRILKPVFPLILLGASLLNAQEVRIASHVSALAPLYYQGKNFAEGVNSKVKKAYDFKLYPSAQLGKEKALITNLKAGSLEMIVVASGVLKLDKKLGIFDLPWLFNDRAHVQRAMNAGLYNEIKNTIEKDNKTIKVLGIYENGFRHIMNSKRAINTPKDLRGLKIRISGGKFRQDVFRKMGATPQKVAWKETFTALQTGVVDGVEAATYGFYGQKHYEVLKHLSITNHVYTPSFLLVSKKFFDSLSKEDQEIFEKVGKDITATQYDEAAVLEAKYFEDMKSKVQINNVDIGSFKEKVTRLYTNYEKRYGRDWLDIIEKTKE
ncbi:C4-dicarboxylate ABC transporter substrate-binding protein [Arcobacter sp. F155]|uniref:TRAP transporter substrate-binding protein n=1 Tax=Arcobacter sp. F155 TaxID=2044512 RepID=UPI00100C2C85|nr:TRAP transporter substrate-binding protein [Arcobacter sp. F155]RXJ78070.1 C4-dicarboxylate ABC transporter substrate-binding protein [Arcobacter sp. F155]